MFFFSLLI